MNRLRLLATLAALLPAALLATEAAAQAPGTVAAVRCESVNNRPQSCTTDWADAIIVRQLSSTRCVQGQNWGSGNRSVWVSNGCRADFGPGRGGGNHGNGNGNIVGDGNIRCESNDNRQRVCNTGWRRAALVRQLSKTRCIEGDNWGSSNGAVWVTNGCRAEFAEGRGGLWGGGGGNTGYQDTLRCESNDNRQRVCNTGWRRATLVRQLSKAQCVEGTSWGSSNGAVWVTNGCRAEFAEGRGSVWGGGGSWGGGNAGYSIECHSENNRMRSCPWERRRGRPVLIQQLSRTQCIEGRNWGYNGNSVWVNDGCRARFGAR
ncbi:DUF3011 domain-containing protein [Stenotrophomonas mori]|uniref:DUF3011 domain-containing protein n=1 Tax=Stenotrophomonas mori TaxID=2871096 RepID=A0ABT0SDE9_9GAMM|nr:DUF3011 domain-containing protein [Stenotrophomonas mori]MCL7713348.1 DUF3011 domain-containing protein [Stenotrophomonas mori]